MIWYRILVKITFLGNLEVPNISKNQLSRHYGVVNRAKNLVFGPLYGVSWCPFGAYPEFDLARFFSYILHMTYLKINFLGLVVSEEIGV